MMTEAEAIKHATRFLEREENMIISDSIEARAIFVPSRPRSVIPEDRHEHWLVSFCVHPGIDPDSIYIYIRLPDLRTHAVPVM
jgi:hypothetical protein